ncbi:MAG TPA: hypothetical protein VFQ26_01230, partial [Nitrospiraceae bacterium]|nr:hypothetical protein [Nitrospiraceae bacterium]
KLQRQLKEAPKATRRLFYPMLRASAEAVAADARRNVHEIEGDLKRAIGTYGKGLSWRTGVEDAYVPTRRMSAGGSGRGNRAHANPAVYGTWEERGSSRNGAHPFMKPAAESESNRIPARLREVAAQLPDELK